MLTQNALRCKVDNIKKMVYACMKTVRGFTKIRYDDIAVSSEIYKMCLPPSDYIYRDVKIATNVNSKPIILTMVFVVDPLAMTCSMSGPVGYTHGDVLPLIVEVKAKKRKK